MWRVGSSGNRESPLASSVVRAADSQDGISLYDVLPPPDADERTLYRSAGGDTGRPALGGLKETLEPAIAPLRSSRR